MLNKHNEPIARVILEFIFIWLNVTCFFPVERDVNGNLLDEARCETCNGDSPAFTVPNTSGNRY